jgi:hypothetical protein
MEMSNASQTVDSRVTSSAALEVYAREQHEALSGRGPMVRMSTSDRDQSFLTSIVGSSGHAVFIIAMPKGENGRVADLQAGQRWTFRTIHQTTALRFEGIVRSVVADAEPHAYIELQGEVERRVVRKTPRVAVSVRATLVPQHVHAIVIDLSIGGARIAIDSVTPLEVGHTLVCSTALTIADRLYALELKGTVLLREADVASHPEIAVYRVRFDSLSDTGFLVLQAYISTAVAEELDYFWRLVAGPLR